MESHLNRIEAKLDKVIEIHGSRISKSEVHIDWLRGAVKIGTGLLIASLTGLAGVLYNYVISVH